MLLFFCHSFFICIQGSCFPWPKYKVTLKLLQRLFSHPRPTSDKNRESCSNRDSFIRLLKKAHNLKLLSLLFPPETEFPNLCESVNKGSSQKHTFFPLMVSTTKVRLTCELTCTQRGDQTLKHSIKFIFKILEVKMGQQFKEKDFGSNWIEWALCYLSFFSFFLRRLAIIFRSGTSILALGLAAIVWEGLGRRNVWMPLVQTRNVVLCKGSLQVNFVSRWKRIRYQVAQCLLLWYFYWQ